ncbi:hypothetical protein BDV27DRAFT_160118 [Aspergillus caelatus]|uniref:RRM domain-containing protein n=1 Tax=Aspergillus caelatus TaxID=61420 RepID=A0A5N6ZWX6_9EURO|nr:uncharacterized protein BDV27DRAFT_160118 [Aspergillus caelatus]KAE8362087.1 hypothetical protein BDV27DRAFT_160118 [Aspergillus caelatus]
MAPYINNVNINNNINNNNNIQQTNIYPQPPHPNRPINEFYPPLENEPQITFDEVQQRHGLTARLFVGNLSVTVEQQTLMHDLHEAFKKHGSCYVALKYSRTKLGRQLPGAFVQYERPGHAQAALSMEKRQLHGRPLRVEMAVGNRNQPASGSQAPQTAQIAQIAQMVHPQAPYSQVAYPPMLYPQVPYTQVAYPPVPCPPMPIPPMHYLQMPPQGYLYQQATPSEPTSGSYMNPYMAGAPGPYPPVWGQQNYSEQMGYNNYPVAPYPHNWEAQSYPVQAEASNVPVLEQAIDEDQQASSEGQLEHQQHSAATTWEGPLIVDGSVGSNNESK